MHPYAKCEEKDSVCEWCHTPGHAAKVHYTNQKSLRTHLCWPTLLRLTISVPHLQLNLKINKE